MCYVGILCLHHLSPLFFHRHFLLEDLILVEALTLSNHLVLQLFLCLVIFEQEGVVLLGDSGSRPTICHDMDAISLEVLDVLL